MKRVVKDPEIRRQEIIEAAQRLFDRDGYTKTSVEAIIREAGIAKGTFYYYFKAKQDILRAIVESIIKDVKDYFNSIVENDTLSALDKLKEIFIGGKKQETIRPNIMEIVHLPENRELQEQLNIEGVNIVAPLVKEVLDQGYREGVFKRAPSLESVQLVLAGIQFVLESGLFDWTDEKKRTLLDEAQKLFEHLVGVEEGSLRLIVTK